MLEVNNLKIHFDIFDGEAQVLNSVSLYVNAGESVSLVGETGCGKSVTIKTILRMLPIPPGRIVSGEIMYKGRNLLELSKQELSPLRGKEIALVPQEPMTSLNPVFSIEDQFIELIRWQGHYRASIVKRIRKAFNPAEKKAARAKALDLLDKMHIPDPARVLKSYPVELSGGMRQRVLIAMALAGNPSLLIADEPGTALDVTTQEQILTLLKERVQTEKMAVLYITHNLGVAREMSQRIYVMYAGEIVEEAATDMLFRNPGHPYTRGLIASIPKLTGGEIVSIDGRIPDYTDPPQGCRFAPRCPHVMPVCSVSPPLFEVEAGHRVACYLHQGSQPAAAQGAALQPGTGG